jgi:hypothetical protein
MNEMKKKHTHVKRDETCCLPPPTNLKFVVQKENRVSLRSTVRTSRKVYCNNDAATCYTYTSPILISAAHYQVPTLVRNKREIETLVKLPTTTTVFSCRTSNKISNKDHIFSKKVILSIHPPDQQPSLVKI